MFWPTKHLTRRTQKKNILWYSEYLCLRQSLKHVIHIVATPFSFSSMYCNITERSYPQTLLYTSEVAVSCNRSSNWLEIVMSHISRVLMIESGRYCHLQRWYSYIIPGSCPCSLPNRLRAVFSFFARSEEVNWKVISILVTWQLTPMLLSTLLLATARRRLPETARSLILEYLHEIPTLLKSFHFCFFLNIYFFLSQQ